jgi:hypothetical protein
MQKAKLLLLLEVCQGLLLLLCQWIQRYCWPRNLSAQAVTPAAAAVRTLDLLLLQLQQYHTGRLATQLQLQMAMQRLCCC